MDNIFVNMDAFVQEYKNEFMVQAYLALIPDEKGKELFGKLLRVFIDNGIPANKAMVILQEIVKVVGDIKDKE